MNLMKKADIALTTIIVAAIALIVLIVVIAIFAGKIGIFSKSTSNATESFGTEKCIVPGTGRYCCMNKEGEIKIDGIYSDCPSGCCIS